MRQSVFAAAAAALFLAPGVAIPDSDGGGESGGGSARRGLDLPSAASDRLRPSSRFWRAAAEEAGIVASSWALYTGRNFHSEPFPGPGPGSLWKKLRGGAISFDANSLSTNFEGHPLAGTAYYLLARGNRLPAWQAGLLAAGASTAWELVEYRENMSINDMVVTPLAGIAIGETMTQLGALAEQAGVPALAWALNFPRRFHDWIDGVPTPVDPPSTGWRELKLLAAAGALQPSGEPGSRLAVTLLTLAGSLLRVAGYGDPGRGQTSLLDGGGASFVAEGALGADGAVSGRLAVRAVLAGLYLRDLEEEDGSLSGADALVALTAGYRAQMHVYRAASRRRIDRLMLVEAPGLGIAWRAHLGAPLIELRLDLAPAFGGVTPAALSDWAATQPVRDLAAVTRIHGYAFAFGGTLAPQAELRWHGLALGGGARVDFLRGLKGPDPDPNATSASVPTGELRLEARAFASVDLPVPGLALTARWERNWCLGTMGQLTRREGDQLLLGGFSYGF